MAAKPAKPAPCRTRSGLPGGAGPDPVGCQRSCCCACTSASSRILRTSSCRAEGCALTHSSQTTLATNRTAPRIPDVEGNPSEVSPSTAKPSPAPFRTASGIGPGSFPLGLGSVRIDPDGARLDLEHQPTDVAGDHDGRIEGSLAASHDVNRKLHQLRRERPFRRAAHRAPSLGSVLVEPVENLILLLVGQRPDARLGVRHTAMLARARRVTRSASSVFIPRELGIPGSRTASSAGTESAQPRQRQDAPPAPVGMVVL